MATANFAPSRERRCSLLAKLESTYATDPTPAAATDDLFTFDSPVALKAQSERFDFRPHGNTFTRNRDIVAARWYDINFKTVLQTSGANGTIAVNGFAGLDAALSASACTSTPTPAMTPTTIVYTPSTIALLESATIWANQDGFIYEANGAVLNCVMTGSPRGGVECAFKGMGLYVAPVAVGSTFANWTGGTPRFQPFLGVTATINNGASFTPVLRNFTFDMGNQLMRLENGNDSTGIERFLVIDRDPKLTVVIAVDNYASANISHDEWYTDWLSSGPTFHEVDWTVSTTTNTIDFDFNTAQLIDPAITPGGGVRNFELGYKLQSTTVEGEWKITMGG